MAAPEDPTRPGEESPPVLFVEPDEERRLARLRNLAGLLDGLVRIPGTGLRVGVDGVLGLWPGAGDALSAALAGYGIWVAARLGVPREVLARMLGNIALDTIVGTVPVVGDVFDFAFKANLRNLELVEDHLQAPGRSGRAGRVWVGVVLGGVALLVVLLAAGALTLTRWALGLF